MSNVTAATTEGSPYLQAWRFIQRNPGTDSAASFAKLLLSFWNHSNAFAFRECIDKLDTERLQLAVRMAEHFAQHGEDRELVELGYQVADAYPRLWELGQAAWEAKRALYNQWRDEDAPAEAPPSPPAPPGQSVPRCIKALNLIPKTGLDIVEMTVQVPVDRQDTFTLMWRDLVAGLAPQDPQESPQPCGLVAPVNRKEPGNG